MAALAIIGAIGSSVLGAVGAMQEAGAKAAAAETNANIADYNKQVADRNRVATLDAANQEIEAKKRESNRALGSIRAAYGASGLSLGGSPLDVLEDTATEYSLDIAKIRYKGEVKAIGYKDEATNFAMKAQLARMEASSARAAGPISAIGKLFGGASSVGSTMLRTA